MMRAKQQCLGQENGSTGHPFLVRQPGGSPFIRNVTKFYNFPYKPPLSIVSSSPLCCTPTTPVVIRTKQPRIHTTPSHGWVYQSTATIFFVSDSSAGAARPAQTRPCTKHSNLERAHKESRLAPLDNECPQVTRFEENRKISKKHSLETGLRDMC